MKRLFAILLALVGTSVRAESNAPIKDLPTFLKLVEGRELRIGLYDLTVSLSPQGQVTGSALGWGITGTWRWEGDYFCRELDWSGYAIEDNCQLVELLDNDKLRFTTDRGAGNSASFRLR